jgi:hypothetical protein
MDASPVASWFETREDALFTMRVLGPHPEELAKQASRRMDATRGLAAILRDGASRLLRMRPEIELNSARISLAGSLN